MAKYAFADGQINILQWQSLNPAFSGVLSWSPNPPTMMDHILQWYPPPTPML